MFRSLDTFMKHIFFWEKCFYSDIYILTMLFNYTHMKMANLSSPSPNIGSIREVCDRLSKTFVMSLVGNHWATGGLRVNSTPDYNLCSCLREIQYCRSHLRRTVRGKTIFHSSAYVHHTLSSLLFWLWRHIDWFRNYLNWNEFGIKNIFVYI